MPRFGGFGGGSGGGGMNAANNTQTFGDGTVGTIVWTFNTTGTDQTLTADGANNRVNFNGTVRATSFEGTGANPVINLSDSAAATAAADNGRIRFVAATDRFQMSLNTGAYYDMPPAPGADDQVFVSDSTTTGTWRAIPNCASGALAYTAATNTFSCAAASTNTIPLMATALITTASTTAFFSPEGTLSTTSAFVRGIVPEAATCTGMGAESSATPDAGQTFVFTFALDGTDTAITCTINNPATTCNITGQSVAAAAFASWNVKVVTGTGTQARVRAGVRCTAP